MTESTKLCFDPQNFTRVSKDQLNDHHMKCEWIIENYKDITLGSQDGYLPTNFEVGEFQFAHLVYKDPDQKTFIFDTIPKDPNITC